MKKKTVLIFAVAVLVCIMIFALRALPQTTTVTDFAMNTMISVTVTSANCKEDARAVIDEVKRIETLMSATVSGSDIHKLNNAKSGMPVEVSKEVFDLVKLSLEISEKTDGIFDISISPVSALWNFNSSNAAVPAAEEIKKAVELVNYRDIILNSSKSTIKLNKENMQISLGALAKGYAADCCAKLLAERRVKEAIVDLGGNIYVVGKEKTIGIQTPFEKRGTYFTTCKVTNESVVTSGAYERCFEESGKIYHHILDTKSGYPTNSGLESATVVCANSALADGLSTAFFAMGEEKARDIIKEFEGVELILLTSRGETVHLAN